MKASGRPVRHPKAYTLTSDTRPLHCKRYPLGKNARFSKVLTAFFRKRALRCWPPSVKGRREESPNCDLEIRKGRAMAFASDCSRMGGILPALEYYGNSATNRPLVGRRGMKEAILCAISTYAVIGCGFMGAYWLGWVVSCPMPAALPPLMLNVERRQKAGCLGWG